MSITIADKQQRWIEMPLEIRIPCLSSIRHNLASSTNLPAHGFILVLSALALLLPPNG